MHTDFSRTQLSSQVFIYAVILGDPGKYLAFKPAVADSLHMIVCLKFD